MKEKLDVSAAIWAAIIAGLVFVVMEMVLVATAGGGSPWGPPRMIAAIGMGRDVLPPPATFDFGIVMVAMIIHFALSIVLGLILGWAISNWRLGMGAAIVGGIVFGLLVYLVSFYIFTGIFPWFANARNWITVLSHLVYGGVLGGVYRALASRRWTHSTVEREPVA